MARAWLSTKVWGLRAMMEMLRQAMTNAMAQADVRAQVMLI